VKRPNDGRGASLGNVAPGLAHYTQAVLYDKLWERPHLSQRDRSLITIAALIAMYRPDQMVGHIRVGLENGLTEDELLEAISHLALFASAPNAKMAADKLAYVTSNF
jgi:4-carboxymuconolactone decarboxylase